MLPSALSIKSTTISFCWTPFSLSTRGGAISLGSSGVRSSYNVTAKEAGPRFSAKARTFKDFASSRGKCFHFIPHTNLRARFCKIAIDLYMPRGTSIASQRSCLKLACSPKPLVNTNSCSSRSKSFLISHHNPNITQL